MITRGKDSQFPNGCWSLDLEKREFILDVDFLVFMKLSMGIEPTMVGEIIKEVESQQFQQWLKK